MRAGRQHLHRWVHRTRPARRRVSLARALRDARVQRRGPPAQSQHARVSVARTRSGSILGRRLAIGDHDRVCVARVTPRSSAKPSTNAMSGGYRTSRQGGLLYHPWAKADFVSRSRRIGQHRQAGCRGVSGRFSRNLCPVRLQRQQMAPISIATGASDVSQGEAGRLAGCASARRAKPGSNAREGRRVRPIAACRGALAVRPWYVSLVCKGRPQACSERQTARFGSTLESSADRSYRVPIDASDVLLSCGRTRFPVIEARRRPRHRCLH